MATDKAKKAAKKTGKKGVGLCERVKQKGGGYKTVCPPKQKKLKGGKTIKVKKEKEPKYTPVPRF